jgi:hypothetical protein
MGRLALASLLSAALLAYPSRVRASEADYLPDNSNWTGTSTLASISTDLGAPLLLVQQLDWSKISENDVLLVIYPRAAILPQRVKRFLQRGGRVLVADDFGLAEPLFSVLKIERKAPAALRPRYANRPGLPIARVFDGTHPITRGIRSVVTNHPMVMRSQYPTLLGFDGDQQLLVAGKVGAGRFIALSDPSVLINGMLAFSGNALLARQILQYLVNADTKRVLLITGYVQQTGKQDAERSPEERAGRTLNLLLERANDFALTSTGMSVVSFVLGGLLILLLARFLPVQRKDLDGHWLRPGFEPQRAGSLHVRAASLYREQLEVELARLLKTAGPLTTVDPQWAVARCRELAGHEAAEVCRKLLIALRQVPFADEQQPRILGPNVSAKDLETIYDMGEKLVKLLLQVDPADKPHAEAEKTEARTPEGWGPNA